MNTSLWSSAARTARSWRILFILYLSALAAAFPAMIIFAQRIWATFGHSPAAAAIVQPAMERNGYFLADFLRNGHVFSPGAGALVAGEIVTLLLQTFLVGGIVVFAGREPNWFGRRFRSACRQYFGYNIRLLRVFVFGWLLLSALWVVVMRALEHASLRDAPPNTTLHTVFLIARLSVPLLLFAIMGIVVDCARALARYEPGLKVRPALRQAWRYVKADKRTAVGLIVVPLLIGIVVIVPLIMAEWSFTAASWPTVALALLLGQLAVFLRCVLRMARWGAVFAFVERQMVVDRTLVGKAEV